MRRAYRLFAAVRASHPIFNYSWSKEFLETGKRRLMGNTKRQATSGEVVSLRKEDGQLKELVADLSLKNQVLKKSLAGTGGDLDE